MGHDIVIREKYRNSGFSLPEVLAVIAILGVLAAIAIPITISQQNRATEATTKSDLTNVAAAIEAQLLTWRGAPPEALNICNNLNGDYPPGGNVINTCEEGEWKTTRVRNGSAFSELSGPTALGTRIVGRIAADGSYCLDGTSSKNSEKTLFYDSVTTQISSGTCRDSGWEPKGGIAGSPVSDGLTSRDTVPPPPTGVSAVVNDEEGTVTAKWDALPGVEYNIKITGYPAVSFTPDDAIGECILPTDNCDMSPNGTLPGGLYTLTVRAGNQVGLSAGANTDFLMENRTYMENNSDSNSNEDSGSTLTPENDVAEPTSVIARPENGGILVSWQTSTLGTEIIGYRIQWSTNNGETWDGESLSMKNTTSYLVEDLNPDKTYIFQVQAIGTAGVAGKFSQPSNQILYSPKVPLAPRNLTATPGSGKVFLQWQPPLSIPGIPEVTDYSVSVSPEEGNVLVSGNSATISGLVDGRLYTFSVRAQNVEGYSEPVEISETPKLSAPPSRPISLTAEPAENAVRLSWTAPSGPSDNSATDYIIEYSIGGAWTTVDDGITTRTGHTIAGLNNNSTYFFRVAAVNDSGQSEFSEIANATPKVIASGGTETVKTIGEKRYRVHIYGYTGSPQTFNIAKTTGVEILAVGGGGGGGGNEYNYGGGGGSGAGVIGKVILQPGSYTVMVGGGGKGGSSCVTGRGGGAGGFNGGGNGGKAGNSGCSGGGGGGGGWSGVMKGDVLYVVAGGGGGGGGANEGYANDISAKGGGVQTNGFMRGSMNGGSGFNYGGKDGGGGGGGGGGYFGGAGQTCNGCSNSGGGTYVASTGSVLAQLDGNSGGYRNNGYGGKPVAFKDSSLFGYNNKTGSGGNAQKNGDSGVVFIRYQIN